MYFVRVYAVHPYCSVGTDTAWMKSRFILSDRSDFLMIVNLQFTYLSSNISSTESDVNIHLARAWNAIDKLSSYITLFSLLKKSSFFFRIKLSIIDVMESVFMNLFNQKCAWMILSFIYCPFQPIVQMMENHGYCLWYEASSQKWHQTRRSTMNICQFLVFLTFVAHHWNYC